MSKTNAEIVTQFFEACNARDIESVMAFFAEDAEWINMPIDPPNKGKSNIRAFISFFYATFSETEFIIKNQVESPDGLVMNERIDWLGSDGKRTPLPVMGVFEFSDGKITAWRDYFDKATIGL